MGPPTTWSPTTTQSLGYLLAGLTNEQMRSIRDDSCSLIEPYVISAMPLKTLKVNAVY